MRFATSSDSLKKRSTLWVSQHFEMSLALDAMNVLHSLDFFLIANEQKNETAFTASNDDVDYERGKNSIWCRLISFIELAFGSGFHGDAGRDTIQFSVWNVGSFHGTLLSATMWLFFGDNHISWKNVHFFLSLASLWFNRPCLKRISFSISFIWSSTKRHSRD